MNALISFFLLILILFSIKQYKNICLNTYRDKLFSLRHELLVLTFNTQLNCNDTIYRYYEKKINMHIRFAHSISFFRILIYGFYIQKNAIDTNQTRNFEESQLSLIDDKVLKEELKKIDDKIADAFISYLLLTSFMTWIFIFYKLITTKSNIKDGKIDLGVKNKIDETIDVFENTGLGYL